jgi:hypothetical protein
MCIINYRPTYINLLLKGIFLVHLIYLMTLYLSSFSEGSSVVLSDKFSF